MANKIKLIRPDSVQGSAREYLFKLSIQTEKEINEILRAAQNAGRETEEKLSEIDEKLLKINERLSEIDAELSGFEERISELE